MLTPYNLQQSSPSVLGFLTEVEDLRNNVPEE